jgi:hypothetical protein
MIEQAYNPKHAAGAVCAICTRWAALSSSCVMQAETKVARFDSRLSVSAGLNRGSVVDHGGALSG